MEWQAETSSAHQRAQAAAFDNIGRGTDYGLKVIHMTRLNASAAFDLFGKLVAVKSQSEAIELSTVHARQQFDAVSTQSRELWNSLRRSRLT
jgi:hypothetical protein